ncbi:MAG TPA: LLM class flavin-dependent oxidoreductase [Longimicrobiales bacterium]|nr:LLM class flavin-dependent oxidoreductase [Longimicrobiales bacterium]
MTDTSSSPSSPSSRSGPSGPSGHAEPGHAKGPGPSAHPDQPARPETTRPPLSLLDLAPIADGARASDALRNSVALAQEAEGLGYVRHWFAEHHGMPSIASSSPEVLIAHVAAHTKHIRVGSGGIMLPNHVPLRVAEAFHTLEALHPGRIDLGIGRAPGADPRAAAAMRPFDAEGFADHLAELLGLSRGTLPEQHPFRGVRVVPDDVALPPVWLLGSSGASARYAGSHGLGYGFARHFSPAPAAPPMLAYREAFQPSPEFPAPHAILAVSVICAESADEAEFLAGSLDLMWVRFRRSEFAPIPSPEEAAAYRYNAVEQSIARENRARLFVGTATSVVQELDALVAETHADEVMVTTMSHGHDARLRSYRLLMEAWGRADRPA